MQEKNVSKFRIELDPEYEEEMFNRFTELAEKAIEQTVERTSIRKQFMTQTEAMEQLRISHTTMYELYEKRLKFIKIGNKKLIDMDDLKQTLNKLKF